jgi:hypothetical protein
MALHLRQRLIAVKVGRVVVVCVNLDRIALVAQAHRYVLELVSRIVSLMDKCPVVNLTAYIVKQVAN